MLNDKYLGSTLEGFLKDEGIFEEVEAAAAKRVVAFEIEQEMKQAHISKAELARRMSSSRSAVDRLLNPDNTSITLDTLTRAANAVGKKLEVRLAS